MIEKVLTWYLFALGLLFMIIGWKKKTGLPTGLREGAEAFFFVFGFTHLIIGLFLFNAPAAYGSIQTMNKTTFYAPGYQETFNDSVTCIDCNPVVNASCCEHDYEVTYTGLKTEEYQYVYAEGGKEIVNTLLLLDMLLGGLYGLLFLLGWLKTAVESLTRRRPRWGGKNE